MFAKNHILFPTDGSALCRAFVPQVVSVANQFGASVTLLHAAQPATSRDAEASEVARLFEEWVDVDTLDSIQTAEPAAGKLIELEASQRFDLLMIPSRGFNPLRRLFGPSLVERMVREYRGPIWTARGEQVQRTRFRRIVCAVDLGPRSLAVLQTAGELAERWSAELSLVHVLPNLDESLLHLVAGRELPMTLSAEVADQEIARLQRISGARGKAQIEFGDVDSTVSYVARRRQADLLIIGAGAGRQRNVMPLVRRSPCPVLILEKANAPTLGKLLREGSAKLSNAI